MVTKLREKHEDVMFGLGMSIGIFIRAIIGIYYQKLGFTTYRSRIIRKVGGQF